MTVLMIACSERAYERMQTLEQKWKQVQPDLIIIKKIKCTSLPELSEKVKITTILKEYFEVVDAVIFFCAAGIAVRSIAPYICHKSKDPAVIVVDEAGQYSISLLSGHAGGANELAERIGIMLGALPVITTATDLEHKFAVDDFARKNDLVVTDWEKAKQISVRILAGARICIYSDIPIEGNLPGELQYGLDRTSADILISHQAAETPLTAACLQLVPKSLAVGIGCRRDTPEEKIAYAVEQCLKEEHIRPEALFTLASIDLKKEEPGLLSYCEKKGLSFRTYSAAILRALAGDYSESDFVKQVTGVSNVCERSAAAAAGGPVICPKKLYDGVTVALAGKKGSVKF